MPLRRDDGRPVCVLVRKAKIDFVAHIKPGSSVVWGRLPDRFEGVYVRPATKELPWSHYFSGKPDDDMSYWLPMFFGTPHLAAAMRAWFSAEECQPTVTPPPADALPDPVMTDAQKVLAAEIAAVPLEATLKRHRRNQAFAEASRTKLKDGEQNGVH